MANLRDYTDPQLGQLGFKQPYSLTPDNLSRGGSFNGSPIDRSSNPAALRFVMTVTDGTNGHLDADDGSEVTNYGPRDQTTWNRVQDEFSEGLSRQLGKRGAIEARADLSSDSGLAFARAIVNEKVRLGLQIHQDRLNNDPEYAAKYNQAWTTYHQSHPNVIQSRYNQSFAYHLSDDQLKFVATEPAYNPENQASPFGVDDEHRRLHDQLLGYANEVKVSSQSLADRDNPDFQQKYQEDQYNGADMTLLIGENPKTLGLAREYFGDNYVVKDLDQFGFKPEYQLNMEQQTQQTLKNRTLNLYFSPSPKQYEYTIDDRDNQTPSRYYWRDAAVQDDSPVSVDELVNALSPSLVNANHQKALKSALLANQGSNMTVDQEVIDMRPAALNSDKTKHIQIVATKENGKYHYMSPSDVQTSVALISVLKDAHVNYDVIPNTRDHTVDLKINDNSGTKIRLIDPQHPYLVGTVQMRNGMVWEPSLGRLTYHTKDNQKDLHNYDPFAVFSSYQTSDNAPAKPYFNSENDKRATMFSFSQHELETHTQVGNADDYWEPEATIERNARKYAALDQLTKNRIAALGVANVIGLSKQSLPPYMLYYAEDENGQVIMENGKPKVNESGYVFNDDRTHLQTIDRTGSGGYQRRINAGGEVKGEIKPLTVMHYNEENVESTDATTGEKISKTEYNYAIDVDTTDATPMTLDYSNVFQGNDRSISKEQSARATVDPYQVKNPNEMVNNAYRLARINYLQFLTGPDQADMTSVTERAQETFKKTLAAQQPIPELTDDGDDLKMVKPKEPLDIESQKLVLNAFFNGLQNTTYDENYVNDAALRDNLQTVSDSVNDVEDPHERETLRARRVQAYKGLVQQMNDTFGTAPVVNGLDFTKHDDLSPNSYRLAYADRLKYLSNGNEKLAQYNTDVQSLQDVFVKYIGDNPKYENANDYTKRKAAEVLSFERQRELLDEIPHDTASEKGQLYRQDHAVALSQFDQAQSQLVKQNPLDRRLNVTQVIANTSQGTNSVEYKSKMAKAAGMSKYASALVGDTDQASLQVQERAVSYNPKTARSINDLLAEDAQPDSLNSRLHNYLDHVRGFRYIDADGHRVSDAHKNDANVTTEPVEPQVRFNWKPTTDPNDPTQNPYPGAFAAKGTRGDDYHPEDIHLLNDVSPNQFLADRLLTVKRALEKNGANVSNDDIKIDDHGMVHYDANVPRFSPADDSIKDQTRTILTYDQYVAGTQPNHLNKKGNPLFGSMDGIINVNGYAVSAKDGKVRTGDLTKLYSKNQQGQFVDDDGQVVDTRSINQVSADFGQIFAPDYDGLLKTNYYRFDGMDPKAGQKTYLPSRVAWFWNPKQDENGNWDRDALAYERKTGMDHYSRLMSQGLAQVMDRNLDQAVTRTLSTRDVGNVSRPNDSTILNSTYRKETAMEAVNESLLIDQPSFDRQVRIEDGQRRLKFDDEVGMDTNTNMEINKMASVEKASYGMLQDHKNNPSPFTNFVNSLAPDDPERTLKINQFLTAQSMDIVLKQHSPFDAYGSTNIAELGHRHASYFVGDANTGQSKANGGVQFLVDGTTVLPSGRVLPAIVRYQTTVRDETTGEIQHQKGEPVLDKDGKYIALEQGTPVDNTEYNNMAPRNAADRESVAKDQYAKGYHRISGASIATMSLGGFTMEDAIVISEDFANKYRVPATDDNNNQVRYDQDEYDDDSGEILHHKGDLKLRPLMPGDKISDNGGNKATVSVIVPNLPSDPKEQQTYYQTMDDRHLLDVATLFNDQKVAGHPIDAITGPMSQISRNNGATTSTYISNHDLRFAVQEKTADGYQDRLDENGQPQLLTYQEALSQPADTQFAIYRNDGANAYQKETIVDDDNFAHPKIITRDGEMDGENPQFGVKQYAEELEPMKFTRKVKNADGQYVDQTTTDTNGNAKPMIVNTGATLNRGDLTVTDQLVDHKVTTHDQPDGSKGRKLSFLVNTSDNTKGANALANFHFQNGDELRRFRAGLLVMGTDIDSNTNVHAMDDQRFDELAQETSDVKYHLDPKDQAHITDVFDGRTHGLSNRSADAFLMYRDEHNVINFGKRGERLVGHSNAEHQQFDGYRTVAHQNPVTGGVDHELQLSFKSQSFISFMTKALNRSAAITSNSDDANVDRFDAGGDFLNKLPDGGVLRLPDGLSVKDYNGNDTKSLFILPERMRVNNVSTDGQPMVSNMNLKYQQLGTQLAKYQTLYDMGKKAGMFTNDQEKQLFSKSLADNLGIQGYVTSINKEADRTTLGGNQPKNGMFKNDVLGGYGGDHSVTSQLSNDPSVPLNVIEISPRIAKALGFEKDDPKAESSYAHMKGHKQDGWDHVHVHRDPVWREQGSLGFKVKISDHTQSVMVNPAMVSLMDGDFDGDNVGLTAMPGADLQHALKNEASVDRWMMDNNGNNSLLNMDEDVSDNAIRTNNVYDVHGVDQPGHINDETFQIKAFEHMNPAVLSAKDKNMLGSDGHVKPEFLTVDEQSGQVTGWDHSNKDLSIKNTTDFIGKMTDSEIKYRYARGDAKQVVSQFIKASDQKDASLDRDRIKVTLPKVNPQASTSNNNSTTPQTIEGNFHDPKFRSKLVYQMDPRAIDRTQVPRDEQTNQYQISDDDLLKALIKNEALTNGQFDYDSKQVIDRLDSQDPKDTHEQITKDLDTSASGDYRDARQKVDEIVQRAFGFDTQREPQTGEVKTQNGVVSNLGSYDNQHGDGVTYRTEETTRTSLDWYADNGSKGSTGKVDGLIGTYNEQTKQYEGGYIHQPTHKQIAKAASLILDPKTDTVDPHFLELSQKLSEQHRNPQRAVQRALKIKTDATGTPGSMQKLLTAVVANGSKDDMHAAAAIGQAGTQKVLGIKREPIVAGYIAEMLQNPVNEALRGSVPYSRPLFALLGDEKQGQLGDDANLVSVRSATLNTMKDPRDTSNESKPLASFSSDLTSRDKFSTEAILQIASNIGMQVEPLKDENGQPKLDDQGHLQDSKQIENFRTTISRATQPYMRNDDLAKIAHDEKKQLYTFDENNHRILTRDGFVEVMNYLYNDDQYGMNLGVDKENFKRIADKLTPPDENGVIHGNTPIKNIKDVIKGDDEMMTSFMMQLSEEGRPAITEQLKQAKQADNSDHQTEPLFGAEGSEQRNRYLGAMSNEEFGKAIDLSGRKTGRESMFNKIRRVSEKGTAFKIPHDKVNTDGRRRLDSLVVTPKMADSLQVQKDDKVMLKTEDGSQLALNVQVDDKATSGLTISKKLAERLGDQNFTLQVNDDPNTQKELSTFVDNVMDSETNFDDYQSQEQPLRESEAQDRSIAEFHAYSDALIKKLQLQRKEAEEVTVEAQGSQAGDVNELNSLDMQVEQSKAAIVNKVRETQSNASARDASSDSIETPQPSQYTDYQPQPSVNDVDNIPVPPKDEDYQGAPDDYDPYANQDALSDNQIQDTSLQDSPVVNDGVTGQEVKNEQSNDPYASSNEPSDDQVPASNANEQPGATNDGDRRNESVTAQPTSQSTPQANGQAEQQPSRIDKIFSGDDQTPTQYGSTVNMEVANKYFTKAAQTPNVSISQRTNDFYGALNQDSSLYSPENLGQTLKSLNEDYKQGTGKGLFNNQDSEQFTTEAFLGRMNQSSQYANDIKTIVNKKNLINQFNANPNGVSIKTKSLIQAVNTYNQQHAKQNPFSKNNNGPSNDGPNDHHDGLEGPF